MKGAQIDTSPKREDRIQSALSSNAGSGKLTLAPVFIQGLSRDAVMHQCTGSGYRFAIPG
jgi:hypothetical protein